MSLRSDDGGTKAEPLEPGLQGGGGTGLGNQPPDFGRNSSKTLYIFQMTWIINPLRFSDLTTALLWWWRVPHIHIHHRIHNISYDKPDFELSFLFLCMQTLER